MTIDNEYIKNLQHALHRIPELGFDLPRTVAFVKGELDKIGIPYTEKYGKSSIVAELNPEKSFTIAIRADMDALAIVEQSGVEYSSEIEGHMHACGHDAHTAILLGTVKARWEIREHFTSQRHMKSQVVSQNLPSGTRIPCRALRTKWNPMKPRLRLILRGWDLSGNGNKEALYCVHGYFGI